MCRNMLGAGAASNPSSRNSSRDNSRSRDMPPSSAPRVPSGPDASQMNAQELERRLTTIAEELHSNQNMKVCCVHCCRLIIVLWFLGLELHYGHSHIDNQMNGFIDWRRENVMHSHMFVFMKTCKKFLLWSLFHLVPFPCRM